MTEIDEMLDVDVTDYVKANRQKLIDQSNADWEELKRQWREAQERAAKKT